MSIFELSSDQVLYIHISFPEKSLSPGVTWVGTALAWTEGRLTTTSPWFQSGNSMESRDSNPLETTLEDCLNMSYVDLFTLVILNDPDD